MNETARAKRPYHAPRRRARAERTRARIIQAAHREFLAHGYTGATIPGIAAEAGVAVETVYRAATGKAGLLEAAVQSALRGLREHHARQRLEGLRRFAALLAQRDGLRADLSVERAADIIWTVCAQANYDSLVSARGWTHDQYRDWLTDTLSTPYCDETPPTNVASSVRRVAPSLLLAR